MAHKKQEINALSIPWIDTIDLDGRPVRASVMDILCDPDEYIDLISDTMRQAAAVNFLVAVAEDIGWDMYFQWAGKDLSKFNLSGDQPFLQYRNLQERASKLYPYSRGKKGGKVEQKDIGYLNWTVPRGVNISWRFIPHVYSGEYVLCAACILGGIAELPLFARSSGQGYGVNVTKKGQPLYAYRWGETVGQTVRLNMQGHAPAAWDCVSCLGKPGHPKSLTHSQWISIMPRLVEIVWLPEPEGVCLLCGDTELPQARNMFMKGIMFHVGGKWLVDNSATDQRLLYEKGNIIPASARPAKLASLALTRFGDEDFRLFGLKANKDKVLGTVQMSAAEAHAILAEQERRAEARREAKKAVRQNQKKTYLKASEIDCDPRAVKAASLLRQMRVEDRLKIVAAYERHHGCVVDPEVSEMFELLWRQSFRLSSSWFKPAVFAAFVAFAYNGNAGRQRRPAHQIVNSMSSPAVLAAMCANPDWAYFITVLLQR
jgi:hypothetical protein